MEHTICLNMILKEEKSKGTFLLLLIELMSMNMTLLVIRLLSIQILKLIQ